MFSPFARIASCLCVLAAPLLAAEASFPPGSIGLYTDAQHFMSGAYFGPDPWQPFDGYVFVWPGENGLASFETSITFPPDLWLVNVELEAPFNANVGESGELILQSTQCLTGADPVLAAKLTFQYWNVIPLTEGWRFTFGPTSASSVGGAGPAGFDCDGVPYLLEGNAWSDSGYDYPIGASELCPGPPLIAGTLVAMQEVSGVVGNTVEMPLALLNRGFPDCFGYWPPLTEIVLEFDVDADVASLVDFVPSNMPVGWSWQFEPGQFGGTRIHWTSLSGAPFWKASDYRDGLGSLVFQLGATPGVTDVTRLYSESHTPYWGEVALGTAYPGTISSGAVATKNISLGTLKGKF